ncbi:MAG: acetyl/propionyl-CoA carboxylase subuit alpha [Fimbriimonadales bacterium]|nr:MAG: acetyl/propionyl-CoA carboxylase subuit alpha [Fimbriimonadales bacterium]
MPKRRIRRLLIANRGEIAQRVRRTAREMGIRTIGVYTPVDAEMPHAQPDDSHDATPISNYLNIKEILEAAQKAKADAIHPGYGFLSENPRFASAVERAGIAFVGPSATSMRKVGDKAKARATAQSLGIPVAEGLGPFSNPKEIAKAARDLGAPVMLKAVAGGGGKGMKRLLTLDNLEEIIETSQRETKAAFGDDALIVERYIFPARHVEVQVLGDGKRCIALGERECSLQRRHQKILEESPSVAVDTELRERLFDSARRLCEAVGYRNAGTVEFLVGPDGSFYFLEVNARLQVEHPVTEMCTGLDIVRMQLEVAMGAEVPPQETIQRRGHAIEARLNAEDPWRNFLPSAGRILVAEFPEGDGMRVDSGIGPSVSTQYDSLIAKLIAHGENREQARTRLIEMLERTVVLGILTNGPYLLEVLRSDFFIQGETYTNTIDEFQPPERPITEAMKMRAACALRGYAPSPPMPWARDGRTALGEARVRLRGPDGPLWVTAPTSEICSSLKEVSFARERERVWVADRGRVAFFTVPEGVGDEGAQEARAPMTGKVVKIAVKPGQEVSEGDLLAVLEAMKMEYRLEAEMDGRVQEIGAKEGDLVDLGHVIVRLEPAD